MAGRQATVIESDASSTPQNPMGIEFPAEKEKGKGQQTIASIWNINRTY